MPFREVDCVSEFNHATQKVRPRSKTLDDARDLLSPGPCPPKVVSRSRFSGGFSIFNDPDFCDRFLSPSIVRALRNLCAVLFVVLHHSTLSISCCRVTNCSDLTQ